MHTSSGTCKLNTPVTNGYKWLDIARSARSQLKGLDHVTEMVHVTEPGSELMDTPWLWRRITVEGVEQCN